MCCRSRRTRGIFRITRTSRTRASNPFAPKPRKPACGRRNHPRNTAAWTCRSAWAVMYEEAARSLFGPLAMNCMAPDDGNMNVLKKLGTQPQKDKWLRPIVEGKVRSSFAMTEPAPGGGSDQYDQDL